MLFLLSTYCATFDLWLLSKVESYFNPTEVTYKRKLDSGVWCVKLMQYWSNIHFLVFIVWKGLLFSIYILKHNELATKCVAKFYVHVAHAHSWCFSRWWNTLYCLWYSFLSCFFSWRNSKNQNIGHNYQGFKDQAIAMATIFLYNELLLIKIFRTV